MMGDADAAVEDPVAAVEDPFFEPGCGPRGYEARMATGLGLKALLAI